MAKRARSGECTYCGTVGPLTNDHVPPKGLFPKGTWPDLIKVPACASCNAGFSKDDEYFRMMLTIREDVAEHAAAQEPLAAVQRSLRKPAKAKLAAAAARNVRSSEKWKSGIFLGEKPAYAVDMERVAGVVRRTVLGLFFHEFGRRLPHDFAVHVTPVEMIDGSSLPALMGFKTIVTAAASGPTKSFADGGFEYSVKATAEKTDATVWNLQFYGAVLFLAITLPTTEVEAMTRRGRIRRGLPSEG